MFSVVRPNRRLNLLLLAALVHYVNACPCGCLEHHTLYQAVVAALDVHHDHSSHDNVPGSETAVPTWDDHHCDGSDDVVFASNRNSQRSDTATAAVASLPVVANIDLRPIAPRSEHLKSLACENSALGICAQLAVLQI